MKRNLIYTAPDRPANWADLGASPTASSVVAQQQQPHVKYKKLSSQDYGFTDQQYEERPHEPRIPWRAITLAAVLFVFGTALLSTGILLLAGYVDVKYADRTWPLIILGTLMFVPGSYHVRLAYYAFRGCQGYSFDDIPDFD